MGYRLEYSKQAKKDSLLLEQAGLDTKAKKLLSVINATLTSHHVKSLLVTSRGAIHVE